MSADIEAIAKAWMAHQGYSPDDIEVAETDTHQKRGCDWHGTSWYCFDEYGNSNHPALDVLEEATEMARVAIEALSTTHVPVARGPLTEVADERVRQDAKWGEQNHPDVDQVLMNRPSQRDDRGHLWPGGCTAQRMAEEYGIPTADRARQRCGMSADRGQVTYAHILVEEVAEAIEAATVRTPVELREELIQVAAVAVAWVEKLDRAASTEGVSS